MRAESSCGAGMDGKRRGAAMRPVRAVGPTWRWVVGCLTLGFLLAGCSAGGSGGINLPAFDSSSSASASPPVIQGDQPAGQYAFVYANQIWVKLDTDSKPRQLTHLPVVSSAYFAWGPLVWSPDASNIAFVVVSDLTTDGRPRSAGPLYIVDTHSGDVQATAATSNVYGHAYSWYGDRALFYSTGSSIDVYDYSDPSDPRAYPALEDNPGPSYSGGKLVFTSFGDLQVVGQNLYATRFDVSALGATGQVGRARVVRFFVSPSPRGYDGGRPGVSGGAEVTSLGATYSGLHGELLAGAWSIASDEGEAFQIVQSVDTKAATVTAKTCYADTIGNWCATELFQQAATQPYASPPQLAFSRGGSLIALTGQQLYTQARDGSQYSATSPGGWGTPAQWAPGAKYVVATQLVSSSTDARAVVHYQTNLVNFTLGAKPAVFITGAQDFSWAP